jgi:hypothetical protein
MSRHLKPATVLLAVVFIGALAVPNGQAQDDSGPAAAAPFKNPPAFAENADCPNPASAACRRKPHPHPGAAPNADVSDNGVATTPDAGTSSLHIQGDAAAVHLDVRQSKVDDVLLALADRFHVHYRTSVPLDDPVSGSYTGSLGHVLGRVLDNYNYVIKQEGGQLNVVVLGRHGNKAMPAPTMVPLRQHHVTTNRGH